MTEVYPYSQRQPSGSLQEQRGASALANSRLPLSGYSAPPPPPPPSFPANRSSEPRLNGNRQENMTIHSQTEPFHYELNRRYHGYRAGAYMYPNDEKEQDRLDILHKLYLVSRRNELHRAPINVSSSTRILDLGTGTGIWSIDVADAYPDAEVIGTDLSPIQPKWIPRNLQIRICDFESTWTLGQSSFDLIHMRNGVGSVSSWPTLYRNVLQHLKPGYGWFEQVEIDYEPRCDDGTMAPDSNLVKWYQYLADATERSGKPLRYSHKTGKMLADAGFTDIREVIIQVPYSPWSSDPHLKMIGSWYTLAMSEGLESLCIAPFNRINGWDLEQINGFLGPVKKEMLSKKVHAYNNMHIWIARRP
ncbi:hypothetical protein H072_6106 [Dactylellina haptotyla CBS 200.50]|uniref:Methyltransferase domain-containing protein n=1 Tax=Dactylellina haptotyla (strain CBS 200.50) TaxID=1284197 RepID=S8BXM4_DACHA|nr:hypothetical protein H072_6106 [Dactylellina haptotyla CBS 200.50]